DGQISYLPSYLSGLLPQDAPRAVGELRDCIIARLSKRIGGIMMRADEVCRQTVGLAERHEVIYPRVCSRRWAANLQHLVNAFDRFDCITVKFEIVALLSRAKSRQIRLVPDFEIPLAHFRNVVTVHPMADQLADQNRPLR